MAKKALVNNDGIEVSEQSASPKTVELTHSAFTLVRVKNRYSLLKIDLNPETNDVGAIEVVKDDMGKEEAQEVFKIHVARDIFMRQG